VIIVIVKSKCVWDKIKDFWDSLWWNYKTTEFHFPSGRVIRKSKKTFSLFKKKKNIFEKIWI
jgi:hypothetical protein